MAVKTPDSNTLIDNVGGSVRQSFSKFATISDGDTYVSDLGTIIGWSFDCGSSAPTTGLTVSGGTVTFKVTGGPAVTASLILWGF
jgi:hypothetical protein